MDRLLVLVLLLVLLIGVYFIYDTAYVYYHAAAARVTYQRPGTAEETGPSAKSLTEDYVAWLTLDDNEIDTPVMQGEDNSKYLNTDPYGDYSLAGSIFLDSRNTSDFSDSYNLTYGHHMSNHLMFGALDRFYDERYFEQHSSGTLRVGELVYPLQIFAVLATDAGESVLFQPQGSEPVLKLAEEASLYYRIPISDHILALTTCVDAANTSRTAVLCAMGEPYKEGELES